MSSTTSLWASSQVGDLGKLMREWPKRTEKMRARFVYLVAQQVLKDIKARIPSTPDLVAYRTSLDVAQIAGVSPGEAAYVVSPDIRKRRVKKIDASKTILYVKAKKRVKTPSPEIAVLEKYNPWTTQTLPFKPDSRKAVLVSRKATKKEVTKITRLRMRDRKQWVPELTKAGVRGVTKNAKEIKMLPKYLQALPDVALDGIRLEFGLGKDRGRPHWRPSISGLRRGGIRRILRKHPELLYALTRSSFQQWERWSGRTQRKVRLSEAKKFVAFQKKLGIRVT